MADNVIKSTFKLMRAIKRRPPRRAHEFPPTVSHLLTILKENDGLSSGELCELLDIRPSSLSELLARVEEHGLVERKDSEADRRITRAFLTKEGNEAAEKLAESRKQAEDEFSACFTEEEKAQFCALAEKLANHLEASAAEDKEHCCRHGHGPEGHCGHHGPEGHCGHHGGPGHHGHGPHCFRHC